MSSALRNFFVMFFLFLLIFGVCGHYFVNDLLPGLINESGEKDGDSSHITDNSGTSQDNIDNDGYPNTDNNGTVPPINNGDTGDDYDVDAETYTVAFFCFGIDEELVEIYLVHVNDYYKTSVSVSVPGKSTSEFGGFSFTDMYEKYGSEYVISKLFYLTGYTIDDYASLKAVDRSGRGHSITDLSKRLQYEYRVNEAFEYPDPAYESYKDRLENGEFDTDEESSEPEDDLSREDNVPDEFFIVQPDNYPLHGITNGLNNYTILFDSEYNPNAHTIYEAFFKRTIESLTKKGNNTDDQISLFKCFDDKTFSVDNYESTDAAKFLFRHTNQLVESSSGKLEKISDWDEIRITLNAKEKGTLE